MWSYYWFVIKVAEGILGGVYFFQFFFLFCYETRFVQPTSYFAKVFLPISLTILFSLNIRHLLLKHPSPWTNLVSKSSLSLLSRNLFWMTGKYYNPDLYCSWTEKRYQERDSLFWFYLNLFGLGYWVLLCEGFSVNLQWGFTSPKERIRNPNHCGDYLAFTTVTSELLSLNSQWKGQYKTFTTVGLMVPHFGPYIFIASTGSKKEQMKVIHSMANFILI